MCSCVFLDIPPLRLVHIHTFACLNSPLLSRTGELLKLLLFLLFSTSDFVSSLHSARLVRPLLHPSAHRKGAAESAAAVRLGRGPKMASLRPAAGLALYGRCGTNLAGGIPV